MKGVSVIIRKDDKYLMLQQPKAKPFPLKWLNVSGRIEDGETPEEAAVREAREETMLEIEVVEKIITRPADYKTKYVDFLLADWKSGEVVPDPKEAMDFGWFTLEEVLKLDLIKGTRVVFENHLKGGRP